MQYTLQFYDYWHTGSGLSGGTYADLVVNKTAAGLPVVPGKTIKGLLRHSAQDLLALGDPALSQEVIDKLFGKAPEKRRARDGEDEEIDNQRDAGLCWFSNAELPAATAQAIDEKHCPALYEVIASTAIDTVSGTATNHSLRQTEVTIPLTLAGRISGVPPEHRAALERCLRYVKRLGQNRARGLGRCHFKILPS